MEELNRPDWYSCNAVRIPVKALPNLTEGVSLRRHPDYATIDALQRSSALKWTIIRLEERAVVVTMCTVKLRPTFVLKQELILCLLLVLRMDSGYFQSRAVPHTCRVRVGGFLGGRGENKRVLISSVFFFLYLQLPDTLSQQPCDRYTMLCAPLSSLFSHHICHPEQWFLY